MMSQQADTSVVDKEALPTRITYDIAGLLDHLSKGAVVTVARVVSLLDEEDTDDYGVLRPTRFALTTTLSLIIEAALLLGEEFPQASPSTDHEGGIRFDWSHSERQLGLVISASPTGRSYIYHEEQEEYGLDEVITPSSLASWLRWLRGDA
jgi:hypothetical protein